MGIPGGGIYDESNAIQAMMYWYTQIILHNPPRSCRYAMHPSPHHPSYTVRGRPRQPQPSRPHQPRKAPRVLRDGMAGNEARLHVADVLRRRPAPRAAGARREGGAAVDALGHGGRRDVADLRGRPVAAVVDAALHLEPFARPVGAEERAVGARADDELGGGGGGGRRGGGGAGA
jgi:hypothetical protein